jgi:hypothetical protein
VNGSLQDFTKQLAGERNKNFYFFLLALEKIRQYIKGKPIMSTHKQKEKNEY